MTPFAMQHGPTLTDDGAALAPGALQPAMGLALVLAGGAFMAVLAVPAYVTALWAARAHPDLRGALATAGATAD
jgi:hypothetical protein